MKTNLNGQWHYLSIVYAAKNYLAQQWFLNILFLIISLGATAQTSGALKLSITDKKAKEPIAFACVAVFNGRTEVAAGTADLEGNCFIKSLAPGKYAIKIVYLGYETLAINEVVIKSDKITYLNPNLVDMMVQLDEIVITEYHTSLIDCCCITGCTMDRYSCCSCCTCRCYAETISTEDAFAKRKDIFYPNPTPGKITVESGEYMEEVFLFDLNGRLVEKFSVRDKKGELDLSKFQNGTYVLRYPENGKWTAGKVILVKE